MCFLDYIAFCGLESFVGRFESFADIKENVGGFVDFESK